MSSVISLSRGETMTAIPHSRLHGRAALHAAVWPYLSLQVLLALLARLGAALLLARDPAFDMEELEYLRLAANLAAGQGFVGLYGGPQTVHSPLYPYAVRLLMVAVPDVAKAAVLVSMLSGALLVVPVALLAWRLFGRTAAVFAGALVAAHPFLIVMSLQATSEALFLLTLLGAVLLGVLALDLRHAGWAAAAGAATGLSYLARPQAVLLLPLTLLFMLGVARARRLSWRALLPHLLALGLATAMFMLPNILYLHRHTGQWLLDGKSEGVRHMAQGMYAGATYREAAYALADDPAEMGFEMGHNNLTRQLGAVRGGPPETAVWMLLALRHAPSNSLPLIKQLVKYNLPFILPLAALAVLAVDERRARGAEILYLALIVAALLGVQLILPWFFLRYLAPFIPFVLLAAAGGWAWLSAALDRRTPWDAAGSWGAPGRSLAVGLLVALAAVVRGGVPPFRTSNACFAAERAAALWLAAEAGDAPLVASMTLTVPYYAGGTYAPLPYSDGAAALRYLAKQPLTHLALAEASCWRRPYACDWLANGVPDARAQRVHETTQDGCRVALYAWTPAAAR